MNVQNVPVPYILTTMDEIYSNACSLPGHIVSMRTKSFGDNMSLTNYYTGAKYSVYSKWVHNHAPNVDGTVSQQYEYYDYHYLQNRSELGNDYSTSNANAQGVLTNLRTLLGISPTNFAGSYSPANGLIATELMKPLQGIGLTTVQNNAYGAFNVYIATNSLLKSCS